MIQVGLEVECWGELEQLALVVRRWSELELERAGKESGQPGNWTTGNWTTGNWSLELELEAGRTTASCWQLERAGACWQLERVVATCQVTVQLTLLAALGAGTSARVDKWFVSKPSSA